MGCSSKKRGTSLSGVRREHGAEMKGEPVSACEYVGLFVSDWCLSNHRGIEYWGPAVKRVNAMGEGLRDRRPQSPSVDANIFLKA